MHAMFPYVTIHSPASTRPMPVERSLRLRGFETEDLGQWQRLLHEGYDLGCCTLRAEDVRRCIGRLGSERPDQVWPTGGIHVLGSGDEIMCMVRVMLFPTHAELRTARVRSRDCFEQLIELVFHTLRQVSHRGLRAVVMGRDISPDQARLLAEALGWSMTMHDQRAVIHALARP